MYIFEQKQIVFLFGWKFHLLNKKEHLPTVSSHSLIFFWNDLNEGEAVAFIWRGDLNFDDRSLDAIPGHPTEFICARV